MIHHQAKHRLKEANMYRYQRLMVGLNLSAQDAATIRYAAMISRIAKSIKIHFVHIVPRLKIPMSIRLRYPNLFRPVLNQMENVITQYWDGRKDVALAYDVVEGTPLAELMYRSSIHAIDLIVVGNGRQQRKSGSLPEKLALDAPCSVLIIPEGTKPKLTKTLVVTARSKFPASDPATAFRKIAQERRADLLAIDARKINNSAAVLLGTAMKQLIRTVEMPVLVLKGRNTDEPVLETALEWEDEAWEAPPAEVMEISHRSLAA
jgi:nucleotide-binding universal stress UspA family protein